MIQKTNLLRQITEMVRIDQSVRFDAVQAKKDGSENRIGIHNYLIYAIDAANNLKIKDIINRYGYPSVKMLGKKGLENFWLLVQHQDMDIDLQEECLSKCDFSVKNAAFLTDRILIGKGKKQIYGTQFSSKFDKRGDPIPKPIRNYKRLNQIRKSAGLGSYSQYIKKLRNFHPLYTQP